MDKSLIRWTTSTWNPFSGCTKVSPGCDNCYAYTLAERKRGTPAFPVGFDTVFKPKKLKDPLRWKGNNKVFVNSMSDIFHVDFTHEQIAQVFNVMLNEPRHIYQVLTKRPTRGKHFVQKYLAERGLTELPRHIWMGVSVENEDYLWRMDELREIPAPIRFISAEPLLGPLSGIALEGISWVIVGGESGPGFRPMDLDWARELRDKCREEGVAFFYKQGAAYRTEMNIELDGERIEEFPS